MIHFTDNPAAPPEIRNQQVRGSSPRAGSIVNNSSHASYLRVTNRLWFLNLAQGVYQGAYSWFRRLISGSPVDRLQPPDDLSTEERIAEFTRRMRG